MADKDIFRAEDAILVNWIEEYKLQRTSLWNELVTLNTRLFILEKLETFPFDLFIPWEPDQVFWRTTRNALIETAIVGAWRIVVDSGGNAGGDVLTLRHFKNEVWGHLSSADAEKRLRGLLKEVDFDKRIQNLEKKVTHARHNYLAHFNKEAQVNPDPKKIAQFSIQLQDMKDMVVY